MNPGFREVLSKVQEVLGKYPNRDYTVLRDVEGRVRVIVEDTQGAIPEGDIHKLEQDLRGALGGWLGQSTPVWGLRKKREKLTPSEKLIVEELDRTRVSLGNNVHLVERHVAKAAWTGQTPYSPPWSLEDVRNDQAPPILTFFSHKGGVGRSTALIATGLLLAREGEDVVLVDLDLEAPGLSVIFGEDLVPDLGVLDLLAIPEAGNTPIDEEPVKRATFTVTDNALVGDGRLRVLTAGKIDDAYMEMLARLDVHAGARRNDLLVRMKALFQTIQAAWQPKWILVDARAGFHDLGGLMLASLSHAAVMVLTANPQSDHGLRRVVRLLKAPHTSAGGPPIPLVLAHGLAPAPGSGGQAERDRVRERAYDILLQEYYSSETAPSLGAEGQPHDPLPLPWVPALRGQGGTLDVEVAELLREKPYQDLLARVRDTIR